MTSRIPPSRRDPRYAPQRAAKVVAQQIPGAGRVAGVAQPSVPQAVTAAMRGRPSAEDGKHAGAGTYSVRLGPESSAPGAYSVAIGAYATAAADGVAIGDATNAGSGAVHIGANGQANDGSVVIGFGGSGDGVSGNTDGYNTCVGGYAAAMGGGNIAVGSNAYAQNTPGSTSPSVCIGDGYAVDGSAVVGLGSNAQGSRSVALGPDADLGFLDRAVGIGAGAAPPANDTGVVKVDAFEVVPSSGASASSLILRSPNGSRWRLTVSNAGVLSVAAA